MDLQAEFGEIVSAVRKRHPLIHHITNYVTAESCADAALAAGASPVMADDPEEVPEIARHAGALVFNLGTISAAKMLAMEKAAAAARALAIPVILDPAGVMSSSLRLRFALRLLEQGGVSIVRGNYSECAALLNEEITGGGVDTLPGAADSAAALRTAREAALKFGCVVALTGAVDNISNGRQAVVLNNGHPLLEDITGSGCMTSTLCGCCAAVSKNMLAAAAMGVVIMGQAAELAANFLEKKDGPGMFKARLLDGIYHVTSKWDLVHLQPERKN